MSRPVYVKFLRRMGEYQPGDVAGFSDVQAVSLCRHGVACLASVDLRPRVRRTERVETAMAVPDAEQAVVRGRRG